MGDIDGVTEGNVDGDNVGFKEGEIDGVADGNIDGLKVGL